MATVRDPRRRSDGHERNGGMVPLAERSTAFHRRHLPDAHEEPDPFPAFVTLPLLGSIAAGAALGLLVAALVLRGVVTLPGWEAMFADGVLTLYALGAGVGAALGIVGAALVMALRAPAERPRQ